LLRLGQPYSELVAACVLREHEGEAGALSARQYGLPLSHEPFQQADAYHRLNIAFVALAGASIFGFGALEAWMSEPTAVDVATAACTLAFVVVSLVRGARYWSQVIEIARREGA
jgi:hypothetical protein